MESGKEKTQKKSNDAGGRSDSDDGGRERQVGFTASLHGGRGALAVGRRRRGRWRSARRSLPDASWPSDSDVTVLRLKLRLSELQERGGAPGDGPHRADAASMVNLATLTVRSKPELREELTPLSSWARPRSPSGGGAPAAVCSAPELCRRSRRSLPAAAAAADETLKSKLARFFRFYFCSCCKCLYNLEKVNKICSDTIFDESFGGK